MKTNVGMCVYCKRTKYLVKVKGIKKSVCVGCLNKVPDKGKGYIEISIDSVLRAKKELQ